MSGTLREQLGYLVHLQSLATDCPWKVIRSPHGRKFKCIQFGSDDTYTSLEMHPRDAVAVVEFRNFPLAELATQLDDLAMLVRRLSYRVRKLDPGGKLADQASEYLKRHGLQGSPLREGKDGT